MRYKESQFAYNPNTKVYCEEASTLGVNADKACYGPLPSGLVGITLVLPGCRGAAEFVFSHEDLDASEEDVAGWNFVPSHQTLKQYPFLEDVRVLIIND